MKEVSHEEAQKGAKESSREMEDHDKGSVNLRARGIAEAQAAALRARLRPFAEDWEHAQMAVYDTL